MSEINPTPDTESLQAEREELFRYTDLSHPLMQVLFQFQLEENTEQTETYP